MRDSLRRLLMAAFAVAFVASLVAAPVMACDGKGDSEAPASSSGK